jgi:hypothetical protein
MGFGGVTPQGRQVQSGPGNGFAGAANAFKKSTFL